MSLRIQKSWAQLGHPKKPGAHMVRGVGKIINLTQEHIETAAKFHDHAIVVLAHAESNGLVPNWEIIEMRAAS